MAPTRIALHYRWVLVRGASSSPRPSCLSGSANGGMTSIQIAVLGAGPGGYAAAFYAADLGMQVALIDEEKNPGGVCLYRGCIPSKALLHVAKVIDEAQARRQLGRDLRRADDRRRQAARLQAGRGRQADGRRRQRREAAQGEVRPGPRDADGPDLAHGRRRRRADTDLPVRASDSRDRLASDADPVALARQPADDGLDVAASSCPDVPKSLLVIGGGYIGLELGTVYATLGSKVSVVEMTPALLPGADRDLVGVLEKRLKKLFAAIMLNTKVVKVAEEAKDGIRVTFEGEVAATKEQIFDRVLVAIGRRPNSKIPGLETTKVKVDAKGFIETDPQRRTAEPTIFAIGDVAGEPMLAHKASHEARVAG